jgi:hypothetical protein
MPLFDQSIIIEAPRGDVANVIQRRLLPEDQCISLREAPVLIVLRGAVGHVYVLSGETGRTRVRMIAAKADAVRDAFRGNNLRDALEMLQRTSGGIGEQAAEAAEQALLSLEESVLTDPTEPTRPQTIRERLTELIRSRGTGSS